jgi:methylthioribose-1-phosphate isomerase
MKVGGKNYRTIWLDEDGWSVHIIDQTQLPHRFEVARLKTIDDAACAITEMRVRGAPLIGATAAYGLCLALRDDPSRRNIENAIAVLLATRPTAINLRWALEKMRDFLLPLPAEARLAAAYRHAAGICEADVAACRAIGEHGGRIIRHIREAKKQSGAVNILTHCNAGWLATVDWGTALAPVYVAHDEGIPVHIWVDETRPRNQGASLTAWELREHGVPHTLIVDNAGGHLMQHGMVDLCITGTDRTTATGDVCNKIGTYLKALAAHDNGVPFYVGLPSSTIDWSIEDGLSEIPIEEREGGEVARICGQTADGAIVEVALAPPDCAVANPAFDVTPARLITGLITERGICPASRGGLLSLYPERQ